MNTQSFYVEIDVQLNRAVWRALGYGDQPSKAEVFHLYSSFTEGILAPGAKTVMSVNYAGGPGHYKVATVVEISVPWWRRMGFGDRASKKEVQNMFAVFTNRVANSHRITVELHP